MGEMLNLVTHQWRQPLNVLGSINMKLESAYERGKELSLQECLEISHDTNKQLEFMSRTIEDFRSFFRPEQRKTLITYKKAILFVNNIIEYSIKSNNINIIQEFHCNKEVLIYKGALEQVLLSLIKNSLDIFLQRKIEQPIIQFKTYEEEKYCVLEIIDNGGGIDESFEEKIFEPYFTTKDELNGTGIGLYMSKMIIEKHCQGKLVFQNLNNGACFRIYLKNKNK